MMAEIAVRRGDFQSAAGHIAEAIKALDGCEAWNVEWRVHAMAAMVYANLGRHQEDDECRDRARQGSQRVAETLAGEPKLQQSFQRRVARELGARASFA